MALPYPINASQTDAKSPVDDNLMDSIRLDLDYLDTLSSSGAALFTFNVNGELSVIRNYKKALDTAPLYGQFQPSFARVALKNSGSSGSLKFDIRRHVRVNIPITEIAHQYEGATTAIANVAPALATQNVQRATSQIATQSITHAKATINVQSIIKLDSTRVRYNLATAPDADWLVGDSVTFAGCTSGVNNGTFVLIEVNQSGFPSVVISNASGVAQTGAAGTAQIKIMSYNYANPVSAQFAAGEKFTAATHTTGANNGALTIYKTNQGGNNIWVKNPTGATQAGVAGTADTLRWKFGLLSPSSGPDFTVGEKAKMSGHSSGGNNGNFTITALNLDTNNVTVYNENGVVQGGVAGTINTNRWIYSLPTDPSTQVTAGDRVQLESHTTAANNGIFEVKQVNRLALNNIVIYNEAGVAQGGAAGFTRTTRKLVKFEADQSANFTTLSFVEMSGCVDGTYNFADIRTPYQVLEINRGGGSNYNIVIENQGGASQASPAGFVMMEMKSIFTSVPSVNVSLVALTPNQWVTQSFTNFVAGLIPAGTPLGLYITDVPVGPVEDLTITLH